ncbi:hypothetical protein RJT34_11651 [Clitoria ternatea]|uniref:Uncharacterized protein n=1 Tax=Clitoria ternatea TaxID=43366 RepID=A0AAN9PIM2_CLITE
MSTKFMTWNKIFHPPAKPPYSVRKSLTRKPILFTTSSAQNLTLSQNSTVVPVTCLRHRFSPSASPLVEAHRLTGAFLTLEPPFPRHFRQQPPFLHLSWLEAVYGKSFHYFTSDSLGFCNRQVPMRILVHHVRCLCWRLCLSFVPPLAANSKTTSSVAAELVCHDGPICHFLATNLSIFEDLESKYGISAGDSSRARESCPVDVTRKACVTTCMEW